MAFKDHFSGIADAYAAARPEYSDELFDLIAAQVPRDAQVWEPGCGSGQATRGLAARFARVYATDPSVQQIAQHWAGRLSMGGSSEEPVIIEPSFPRKREARFNSVSWSSSVSDFEERQSLDSRFRGNDEQNQGQVVIAVEPGERTALPDASVQLVAVAQALHWFDRDAFFAECNRVLMPGGVLAAWGYADFVAPEGMVDAVEDFRARIDPYWPPERALIDAHYAGFVWPFPALPTPELWLEAEWTLPHFLRYLSSMSAAARCRADTGDDPIARHAPTLAEAWGQVDDVRTIQWPLFLHLRRKPA
ncbi:MAG TPA: class I SAM-dependent methyltransferase [Lysobacter sp.]|jgi:SAM-dependent methyltransferase|nr:class I SAM-dependent methyltransferase [Lysobacter sp.]